MKTKEEVLEWASSEDWQGAYAHTGMPSTQTAQTAAKIARALCALAYLEENGMGWFVDLLEAKPASAEGGDDE